MFFLQKLKNRLYFGLSDILSYLLHISVRAKIAHVYIRGSGIEVGALHNPLVLSSKARVTYVDRMTTADLRRHYPEFQRRALAPVSIVADGETLEGVPDRSQDFVIGNHLIEHAEDPIRLIKNWLRVLRAGGIIYLSVPDKRFTFDSPRQVTTIEHLVRDHLEGPAVSRRQHYREWVEKVMCVPAGNVEEEAARLERQQYSIHYHVWETEGFLEFLMYGRKTWDLPFESLLLQRNKSETIFILSKRRTAAS